MSETRSRDYPDPNTHVDDGPAPELAPREASQGVKGHNVRFVLTISTLGAVVAVALAYVLFFAA
jgi:adenine/guanine phosphoribosyltransferase-like PRPP-binding protein